MVGPRGLAVAAVLLGGGLLGGRRAVAEDEPARRADHEIRWIQVGALTHPRSSFVPDRGPVPARADDVNDEANPLFGGESEEGVRPYGTIDEVIELLKSRTPRAGWETEGTAIVAAGGDRLVLRGTRALLDAAAGAVADLEREALSIVTIDLVALEGDGAAAAGERGVENGLRGGALRIVGATRACAAPGQRVAVLSGGERAYLQDHDVEVAEEASTTDPTVGVLTEGLCADLRPALAAGELSLDVRAWVAALESLEPRRTAEGETVEVPTLRMREARAPMLKVVPGTWSYLAASKDFGFAVRASVRSATPAAGGTTLPSLPRAGAPGALETAVLDVSDLAVRNASTRAPRLYLQPTHYKVPEPPELPEPRPLFAEDALVDTVKASVDTEYWETEGTSLEVRNHRLIVRADAAHVAATQAALAALRAAFVRSYRVKATIVSIPLASFPEFVTGIDDGTTFLADGGAALLARPGAVLVERVSVRLLDGGRMGVVEGTLHRYVGDYDVEIAKKAPIGKPRVLSTTEGVSFDVALNTTGDGASLALDLRLDRSTWREARRVKTRHGDLELPSVGMQRVRGSLLVPVGATRLAGLWAEGDRAMLVLLTALSE